MSIVLIEYHGAGKDVAGKLFAAHLMPRIGINNCG